MPFLLQICIIIATVQRQDEIMKLYEIRINEINIQIIHGTK